MTIENVKYIYKFFIRKDIFQSPYDILNKSNISNKAHVTYFVFEVKIRKAWLLNSVSAGAVVASRDSCFVPKKQLFYLGIFI